jgi:hypothetical protein
VFDGRGTPLALRAEGDMGMAESECFVCKPTAEQPAGSQARALCVDHKKALTLEDGQSLRSVLKRATPPDSPLEGSMLAWIYNPAFVRLGSSAVTRVWLDFVAGGMAGFEDRFSAQSYFEFCALEQAQAGTLLYLVRLATLDGVSMGSLSEAVQLIAQPPKHSSFGQAHSQQLLAGFDYLARAWNLQHRFVRCRGRAGRLWPESHDELQAWIEEACVSNGQQIEGGTDARFVEALNTLAARRFPVLP